MPLECINTLCGIYSKNFAELNFRGAMPIHEKSENYAPQKFGSIVYGSIIGTPQHVGTIIGTPQHVGTVLQYIISRIIGYRVQDCGHTITTTDLCAISECALLYLIYTCI